MISSRPEFLPGEHFRINRKAGRKWRFTTLRTTRLMIDRYVDETISFRDRNGIEWMRMEPSACGKTRGSIREGYSWDGATMVPDFCLHLDTLVHDAFYQFRRTDHFPFSRRECDDAFLDLMKLGKTPNALAMVYWRGVRTFGGAFRSQNGEWSKVLSTHCIP
jgi:hypothetical protein